VCIFLLPKTILFWSVSVVELTTFLSFLSYLPYLFEYFTAFPAVIRCGFKSLSHNYKNPIFILTSRFFLIKVGSGGKMWENLVGLDEFSVF